MPRPIITLLSDFGTSDYYVAAMKAVLLKHCPDATLVDITHTVAPYDILGASILLEWAVASFGPGTVHLAVVDPGVGTDRRIILAEHAGQQIICPDNGLISWMLQRNPSAIVNELRWRPAEHSRTFQGRDIMAPAAGMLAGHKTMNDFLGPLGQPILLDIALARGHDGRVIHIDHFGSATTNIPSSLVSELTVRNVKFNSRDLGPVRGTYRDVPEGEPLALIGSSDLLEIAVNCGSAAELLGLNVNDSIILE